MTKTTKVLLTVLFFSLGVPQVWAQRSGGSVACSTTLETYRVHFTAYQAPKGMIGGKYMKRYCKDIPLPGQILITLDIFRTVGAEIVRSKPVAVQVLRGLPGPDAELMLEVPPTVYSSGIIEIRPTFTEKGAYHLIVGIGDPATEENTATIPIRVGVTSEDFGPAEFIRFVVMLALGLIGYFGFKHYKKKQAPQAS